MRISPLIAIQLIISSIVMCQPRIEVLEGMKFELGTLYEGSVVLRQVSVKNDGADTLLISSVTTSCGCTVAKISSSRIGPLDTARISISFDSRDVQGEIKRDVYIISNDSTHPNLDIVFTGNIITIIEAHPRFISFGSAKLHHPEKRTIEL